MTEERKAAYKRFAKKLRLASTETVQELTEVKGLVDMPIGTLLEISDIEPKRGANGSYGIATFSSIIKGKRTAGKVCLPQRLVDKTDFHPPCIVLCMGMKEGSKGHYHNVHALPVVMDAGEAVTGKLRKSADTLRKMSLKEVEALMTVSTLSCLDEGTVVTYTDPRKISIWSDDECHTVVKFECEHNDQYRFGSIALPAYANDLVKDMGVFLYKGMKKSKDNKKYHDICFFTDEQVAHFFE